MGHAITALPAEGQRIAGELARRLPDVASRAGDAHADNAELLQSEPQQEKRGLFRTLEECFLALAARGPLLLIVEDLHWSDDISLEFLLYLARRIAAQPLLLLLTYRSDEVRPGLSHFLAELDRERLATENALPRLSMDEVHMMLRAMLAPERPVRAEFLQAIYTLEFRERGGVTDVNRQCLTTQVWVVRPA
jgi:predicted ATPase